MPRVDDRAGTDMVSTPYLARLQAVVAAQGDAVAVVDSGQRWTYSQLWERIEGVAQALRHAGVGDGDRIALVAENSCHYLAAAFGVWAADAVLVTMYPSTPTADLAYTLADCDPAVIMVDHATVAPVLAAVGTDTPVVLIDEERLTLDHKRDDREPTPCDLRAPVHLICYSSGTTSRPKAIMLSAEGLDNGAATYAEVWHLSPADRTIVCLPMAWMFGLDTTSMATLAAGGTVLALQRSRPEFIVDAIEHQKATFLAGVTTMFVKLAQHLDANPYHDLSSLRLCVSGGEPRNEPAFTRLTELTGVDVFDNYCASECFPLVTYDPAADLQPKPGAAGKVVPRSSLRVVDANGADVGTGQIGEALSRGPGLMLGYWHDPEHSQAALTPDGWYRTNDLVSVDEQGYVYVVGRLSDMIIRGGSNVSPSEVEQVLLDHPGVRDAAVVGLPDDTYGQQVVAVIVPAAERLEPTALAAHATKRLASFKVPTEFILADELPHSSTTGKVDRRRVAAELAAHQTAEETTAS